MSNGLLKVLGGNSSVTASYLGLTVTTNIVPGYTPIISDSMSYASQTAFLAQVPVAAGGTNDTGIYSTTQSGALTLYNSTTASNQFCANVDSSAPALYHGASTIRYDFPPTTAHDTAPVLHTSLAAAGSGYKSIWTRYKVKFDSGSVSGKASFTTYGVNDLANGKAYKFFALGGNRNPGSTTTPGGAATQDYRLEIDSTQFDYYEIDRDSNSGVLFINFHAGAEVAGADAWWTDNNWHDLILLRWVNPSGQKVYIKWWTCVDGGTPVMMQSGSATTSDGSQVGPISDIKHGLNYNQARATTYALWRGPYEAVDASVYTNPYNLPAADLADLI